MSSFDPNSKLVKLPNANEQTVPRHPGGGPLETLQRPPQAQPQEQPKVISDVKPPENINTPSEESIRVEQKLIKLRNDMKDKMTEFNTLFREKILAENKTQGQKDREHMIMGELIHLFTEINNISTDEGTISLLVLCLRHLLSLRDAGNDISYKIYTLEKEVFGEATEDKKRKAELLKKKEKLDALQKEIDEQMKQLEG